MKEIQKVARTFFKKNYGELTSVEFLRAAVSYFDHREETKNEKKSIERLLKDYANALEKGE